MYGYTLGFHKWFGKPATKEAPMFLDNHDVENNAGSIDGDTGLLRSWWSTKERLPEWLPCDKNVKVVTMMVMS